MLMCEWDAMFNYTEGYSKHFAYTYICDMYPRPRPPYFQPSRCPVFLDNSRHSLYTCGGDRQAVRSKLREDRVR